MVDKLLKKGEVVYSCELCGFGYRQLEDAELCEEYCDTHGDSWPDLHKNATYKPSVRTMRLEA